MTDLPTTPAPALWGPVKHVLAFRAGYLDRTAVSGHPQFGMTLGAFDHPVINQLQYAGFIQSDYHIVANNKCGNPAEPAPGEFRMGFRVGVDILFREAYFLLGKKLFRRFAMGSGLGCEHDHFLHYYRLHSNCPAI